MASSLLRRGRRGWLGFRLWARRRGCLPRGASGVGDEEPPRDLGDEEAVRRLLGSRAADEGHDRLNVPLGERRRVADAGKGPRARGSAQAHRPDLGVVLGDQGLLARELEHHLDALLLDEGDKLPVVLAAVVGELALVLRAQLVGHEVPGLGEVALDRQAVQGRVVAKELPGDVADLRLRGRGVLAQPPDERRAAIGIDMERERTEEGEVDSVGRAGEREERPDAGADGEAPEESVLRLDLAPDLDVTRGLRARAFHQATSGSIARGPAVAGWFGASALGLGAGERAANGDWFDSPAPWDAEAF